MTCGGGYAPIYVFEKQHALRNLAALGCLGWGAFWIQPLGNKTIHWIVSLLPLTPNVLSNTPAGIYLSTPYVPDIPSYLRPLATATGEISSVNFT